MAFARCRCRQQRYVYRIWNRCAGGKHSGFFKGALFRPCPISGNGNKTKLIGWYPRRTGVSFTQATGVVDFGTIDGKTDIMATPLKEGKKDAPIQSLAFSHLLTQISVKVYAPDAATQALWGKVKSIKVTGKKQGCTFKVPAVTSADGTTITDLSFTGTENLDLVSADPVTPSSTIAYPLEMGVGATADDAVLAGYAMFAPQTADAIELQVDLVAGGLQKPKISFLPTAVSRWALRMPLL